MRGAGKDSGVPKGSSRSGGWRHTSADYRGKAFPARAARYNEPSVCSDIWGAQVAESGAIKVVSREVNNIIRDAIKLGDAIQAFALLPDVIDPINRQDIDSLAWEVKREIVTELVPVPPKNCIWS